ncbi:MAG: hypothetical protein KKB30_06990 [Proteobacteria bacterium]|nr:hypothetical protein [Pseudomonadota bacterium]MBU1714176.1 hypothetical protein [Pseudomonadota bacterium]
MKIYGTTNSLPVTPKNSVTKKGDTNGINFNTLLEEQIHNTVSIKNNASPSPIELNNETETNFRMTGLAITESTLDTLCSYGEALANTSFSAPELEPFISALEQNTLALLTIKNELPANNSLTKLLDNLATISYVETAKYRRGDYNA